MKKFWETMREYQANYLFADGIREDATRHTFETFDGGRFVVVIGKSQVRVWTTLYSKPDRSGQTWCFSSWQQFDSETRKIVSSALGAPATLKLVSKGVNDSRSTLWARTYIFTTKGN